MINTTTTAIINVTMILRIMADIEDAYYESNCTPEEENYFLNLYKFSIPGLILAGAALVTFIVYLVKRFLLKGCLGPKNVIKSYHYTTYFFIIFGCLIGIVFHSFMIYNAAKSK